MTDRGGEGGCEEGRRVSCVGGSARWITGAGPNKQVQTLQPDLPQGQMLGISDKV